MTSFYSIVDKLADKDGLKMHLSLDIKSLNPWGWLVITDCCKVLEDSANKCTWIPIEKLGRMNQGTLLALLEDREWHTLISPHPIVVVSNFFFQRKQL